MKKLLIIIIALGYLKTTVAQTWFKTYDYAAEVADICSYKNSFFGFGGITIGGKNHYYILRIKSNGDTIFTKKFMDTSDSTYGSLYAGFVDYNKDLVMVGYPPYGTIPSSKVSLKLIKTDSLGNLKWIKTFPNTYPNGFYPRLVQTSDTGYAIFGEAAYKGYFFKTDKNGNLITTKDYGYTYRYIKSVIQNADSGFTFCGFTNPALNGVFNSFVCKTNSVGDTIWTKRFYDSNRYFFWSLSHESNGGYYIGLTDTSKLYILKLSSTGNVIWKKPVNKQGYLFSINTDQNNNIIASGMNDNGSVDSVYFVKFNQLGSKVFEKSWGAPTNYNHSNKCFQHTDYSYLICGYYSDSSLVIKMDSNSFVTNIDEFHSQKITSNIFPNPSFDKSFRLFSKKEILNIEIFNSLNQNICDFAFSTNFDTVILKNSSSGLYYIRIKFKDGTVETQKVILE